MNPAFVRLFRAAPRAILAASVAALALGGVLHGGDVTWIGSVMLSSSPLDDVDLLGNATVTIGGTPTVIERTLANVPSGPGTTTLTLNNVDGTQRTLQIASATTIASGPNQILNVGGSAHFRTGVLFSGGYSNVQLVKSSGTGELIIDGVSAPGNLVGAQLLVIAGTMSIEGSAGLNPIASLVAALVIDGPTGTLRFGSTSGAGTVFNNNVLASQSGTLEHTTATADTLGGGLTVASGKSLTANITGGSLAVNGVFNGSLTKNGNGTLRFAGTSSAGALAVSSGRLEFTGQVAMSGTPTISNGATLALLLASGNSVPSTFTVPTGTLEIVAGGVGGSTVALTGGTLRLVAGGVNFASPVTASGASALDVTGVAAQLNTLTLQPGVVLTKTGTELTAASLGFSGAGSYTINTSGSDFKVPAMTGAAVGANLVKGGIGLLEFTGTTASTGTTAVNAGTLRVGTGGGLPSGAVAVNGGRLEFTRPATLGSVPTIANGATLALLSGTGNSVPATFTLPAGTLEIVPGGVGGSTVALSGGTLRLLASGPAFNFTNPVTASGASAIEAMGVAAQLAALTLQPGVVLTKTGTQLTTTSLGLNGAGTFTINTSGSDFKVPAMTGAAVAADLVKTGAGVLEITGTTASTGTTTVSAGTLRVGDGGALPSGAITDNATLEFNRSTALTVANAITGTGTVTKTGIGTLNLNGAQGYAVLNANAGTTNLNGSFTSGTAVVNANATTKISSSQKLAALNIGAGAVVTFAAAPPPFADDGKSFQSASLSVPEPGALGLLLTGALGALARRRRA